MPTTPTRRTFGCACSQLAPVSRSLFYVVQRAWHLGELAVAGRVNGQHSEVAVEQLTKDEPLKGVAVVARTRDDQHRIPGPVLRYKKSSGLLRFGGARVQAFCLVGRDGELVDERLWHTHPFGWDSNRVNGIGRIGRRV